MEAKLTTYSAVQEDLNAFAQSQEAQNASAEQNNQQQNEAVIEQNQEQAQQSEQDQANNQQQEESGSSNFALDFEVENNTNQSEQNAANQQTQVASFNLDEEIKKIDKKELAKKIGLSDFALEIDEHISKGGSPIDYLTAKAIDYNKISDIDLVRDEFKKKYAHLDDDKLQKLFERTYKIGELDSDEDKEIGLIQIEAEGKRIRDERIEKQKSFKIADKIEFAPNEELETFKKQQQELEQTKQAIKNYYENHEATKNLVQNKRVVVEIGDGIQPFKFNIDKPEVITSMFTDGGKIWSKVTSTQTGEPNVQKQQLINLFAINPDQFIKDIFNYGKSYGVKDVIEEGLNAQRPNAKTQINGEGQKPTYSVGKYGN